MTLLPDPILEGVGDSLLTATDRCAYTISVPRMYKIVGREGVKALQSEKWQEAWEACRQQQSMRAAQEKKKKKKIGRKRSGIMIFLGEPHFKGLKL